MASQYIRRMTGTEKWARPMALIDRWEGYLPFLLALVAGVLYFLTMATTVGHTDAGELAAVAYTHGVAHPTGYPLFTLLGWIFSRLPIGTVIFRLNFLSMFYVTGGVYVWARFLREFFIQLRTTVKKGDSSYAIRIKLANLLGTAVGTLMLCFGRTWWTQATGFEVYSLQCLLFGLMLWALLRAWYAKDDVFLRWSIFVVALAMCFTNHLTAIILLPGVFYIYFVRFRLNIKSIRQGFALAGIGFVVLILFYGMMVLVAQSQPTYNWGNPEDWTRLWHHISGRQFRVQMFLGPKQFMVNFVAYLNRLPNELGWDLIWPKIPIWIGLGGIVFQGTSYTFERRREWAIFLALGFFSNIFWAANYSIKDPEPYFLFSFMVVAFLGAMFLRWAWLGYKKFAPYFSGAFAIVLGFQVFWNFQAVNQRAVNQYDTYARAALESLPQNAIVLSRSWDFFVAPAYYLQACEGLRKDVTIIDYSLLHDRHWYAAQMRAQDPALAEALGPKLAAWELAVSRFDLDGIVDPRELQPRFEAVYHGILDQFKTRPVCMGPEVLDGIMHKEIPIPSSEMVPVPDAFFVFIQPAAEAQQYHTVTAQVPNIEFGGNPKEQESISLKQQLSLIWRLRADYEDRSGHGAEAGKWRERVLELGPIEKLEP